VPRPSGIALLLTQLGAHTARRFAARLAELDLTPAHVAVLRVVGQNPGLSQQAVSERMGALPSQIVRLVDELEERGLVERRRSQTDRRHYELYTPEDAGDTLDQILRTVGEHDAEITDGLTAPEKKSLAELLGKLAAANGLNPQAHPAYTGHRPRPGGGP
jgi:DNA-binding MarR family transcriptional regulator